VRRRARAADASSLELLLDTMCNAFGGVMFIAMLLAILSQFTEVRAPAEDGMERMAARKERLALAAEAARLRSALSQQKAILDATFRLHANRPMLDELAELKRRNERVGQELEQVRREGEEAKRRAEQKAERTRQREREIEAVAARLTEAEKLKKQREKKTLRGLRMPRIRRIQKAPFWAVVKWDRLYLLHWPSRFQTVGEVNRDEVKVTRYEKYMIVEPRPEKGVDLGADWRRSEAVAAVRQHVSKESYILYFAVYPDSYESFRKLRDFVVDKGYDYYWSIQPDMDIQLRLEFVTEKWFDGM
jgi:hypothetical protein